MTKLRLRKIIAQPRYIFSIFVLLALIASAQPLISAALSPASAQTEKMKKYNNYTIFKSSFYHLIDGKDLYVGHPQEHHDLYKYTPTFAAFFSLLAIMPDWLGLNLWVLSNALMLFAAIYYLPMVPDKANFAGGGA